MTTTGSAPQAAELEVDPFNALAVHYGMLLGVSDFQVLAANPRGKAALHQAWQHGKGVVWGFPVSLDHGTDLLVGPGLCTDGLGREVASASPMCLDVRAWMDAQQKADPATVAVDGPRRTVDARLVVRHRACLSRPVPSVSPGWSGADQGAAYSRVRELAELDLTPYTPSAVDDRDRVFEQLREFVRDGTLPAGQDHLDGRLAEFREVVARLVAALGPPGVVPAPSDETRLFPEGSPGEVVLADLPGLTIVRTTDGWRLEAPVIDLSVRRTHVPTWVISELIGELLDGGRRGACASDARGPRVERVHVSGSTVTVEFSGTIVEATLPGALEIRGFDAEAGWGEPLAVHPSLAAGPGGSVVTVELPAPPRDVVSYRLRLRGTGPTPLVGLVDGRPVPLAGLVGGPPGSRADGHDVVRRLPGQAAGPTTSGGASAADAEPGPTPDDEYEPPLEPGGLS